MHFFFLRSISFNMVDVDNQKVDWRQLLEKEDSMPSSSQWMSPQSLSHSESVGTLYSTRCFRTQ